MRPFILLGIAVIAAGTISCAPPKKHGTDVQVIPVAATDPEMVAAIAKAKSTLPAFFEHWKHPGLGETDFNLKLKVEDGESIEHLWMGQLEGTPGHITAVVNDSPQSVHSVKLGQRIPIPIDMVSDWLYLRNGKMEGNFTLRALFKKMNPEDVKAMKSKLADP